MILADTSVWIGYLRGRDPSVAVSFEARLRSGEIAICGPVVAELLAGQPSEDLKAHLHGLPYRATYASTWTLVGDLLRRCRRAGVSAALADATIAATALENGDLLWAGDKGYVSIRSLVPELQVEVATMSGR